ncbi:hypothetical protein AwDysgo_01440 [Bacteroidales bacterium]|nr:hypothetical protein AwDysgo_01440 [Bacteroidales bacterium]
MEQPLDDSLKKVIDFFEQHKYYTKDDIVLYLRELIRIHQLNNKTMLDHLKR